MFAETAGDVLTMISFFVLGIYLGPVLVNLTWQMAVYGVLSLAVVRLVAVVISLIGSDMRVSTLVYVGWFGPRGLATLILTIEVVGASGLDHASTIANTALFTVALSVLAHGATAWWGSNVYADVIERASGWTVAHGERTDSRRRSAADAFTHGRPGTPDDVAGPAG